MWILRYLLWILVYFFPEAYSMRQLAESPAGSGSTSSGELQEIVVVNEFGQAGNADPRSLPELLRQLQSIPVPEQAWYCCGLRRTTNEDAVVLSREIAQAIAEGQLSVLDRVDLQKFIHDQWWTPHSQHWEMIEDRCGNLGVCAFMAAACVGITGVYGNASIAGIEYWRWIMGGSGFCFANATAIRCLNAQRNQYQILEGALAAPRPARPMLCVRELPPVPL